jgi:hypothetical protein
VKTLQHSASQKAGFSASGFPRQDRHGPDDSRPEEGQLLLNVILYD